MGNKGSSDIIPSRKKLLKMSLLESPKNYVVVFDIDRTLCNITRNTEFTKKNHPECPVIKYVYLPDDKDETNHVFLPYLHILFEYLIQHGARIVFYSSAIKERNESVIPKLLHLFWGQEKYEKLKSEGQFDIFSRESLRAGHSHPEGNTVKDLKVVIRDTESLLDAILLEDDSSYTAYDQAPCLYVIECKIDAYVLSERLRENKKQEKIDNFSKNGVYYMLGVFKTYFEDEKYNKLPLRVGIDQILPKKDRHHFPTDLHPFRLKMMLRGLKEVQKHVHDAVLYTMSKRDAPWARFKRKIDEEKFSEETNFESFVRNLRIGNVPLYVYYLAKGLSERAAGKSQSAEFDRESTVNQIRKLKHRDDVSIEEGPKNLDLCIYDSDNYCVTTFAFVSNEGELEEAAKKAVQDIQPQVNERKLKVSAGVAFSANSCFAAYKDRYTPNSFSAAYDENYRKEIENVIYTTDIYVR